MIRKLLATTALASIIATGAYAQGTTAPASETPAATAGDATTPAATDAAAPAAAEFDYIQSAGTDQYLESTLVGQTVYGQGSEETSGEIENYLVGSDGKVAAVIIDTGSILDEAKVVAVPADKITWSMGENSEPRATLTATRDELASAPAFTETTAADAATTGVAAPASPAATDTATTDTAATTGTAAPAADATAEKPMDSAAISTDSAYPATVGGDQYLSQNIVGGNVYAGPSADAESIGSVNDLVLSKDGEVVAAVIGVGGFLGIGEKNVGVPFTELKMTRGDDNEPRAVLAATKEQLTAAPTFEGEPEDVAETAGNGTSTNTAAPSTTASNQAEATGAAAGAAVGSAADATADAANRGADATANAADDVADTANRTAATDAAGTAEETTASTGGADRSGMTPVTGPELSADKLVGTTVYGPNDASIGSVGDIALSQDGQVDAIIVDVGGFLGIGKKQVAVAMDNLQFMKDAGGSLYLYTQFSEDQLKNAPEYNSDTYAQNRDTMRLSPGDAAPAAGEATPAPAQ